MGFLFLRERFCFSFHSDKVRAKNVWLGFWKDEKLISKKTIYIVVLLVHVSIRKGKSAIEKDIARDDAMKIMFVISILSNSISHPVVASFVKEANV